MISSTTITASKKDFTNGLITITCTPSNQQAIIMWTLQDGTPLWTAYPSYIFEPNNLNHTVTVLSAPTSNTMFVCGLPNPEGSDLLDNQTVTITGIFQMNCHKLLSIMNNLCVSKVLKTYEFHKATCASTFVV